MDSIEFDNEEYVKQLECGDLWLPDIHIWDDGSLFSSLESDEFTLFDSLSLEHKKRIALIYISRWKKFGGIE